MIKYNSFKWLFRKKAKPNTANIAKLRLQAALISDKKNLSMDFLPKMEEEIIEVLRKYIEISNGDISCDLKTIDGEEVLDLSVNFQRKKPA